MSTADRLRRKGAERLSGERDALILSAEGKFIFRKRLQRPLILKASRVTGVARILMHDIERRLVVSAVRI